MARTLLGRDSQGRVIDIAIPGDSGMVGTGSAVEGPAGPRGPEGPAGPQGPKGDRGDAGERGTAGAAGTDGAPGPAGEQGPEGPQGPKGDTGTTGPAGQDGAAGAAGAAGSQGDVGPKGDRGDIGPAGIDGAAGEAGVKGDTGLQGPKGDTGQQGVKGDTGIQGTPGVAAAPVYATLAAGSTAMGFGTTDVVKVTPNAAATYTSTVPVAGKQVVLLVLTSGTTSRVITFGSGFKPTATLTTGTTSARVFAIEWVSDGTNLYEVSRTVAMVA